MPPEGDNKCQLTFSKQERLCSRKDIEQLLQHNNVYFAYPFKCFWSISSQQEELYHRMVIAVPKHTIKRAVDRNRIKRLVREAYRLNKNILYKDKTSQKVDMLFVCVCKEPPLYTIVTQGMKKILSQIATQLS